MNRHKITQMLTIVCITLLLSATGVSAQRDERETPDRSRDQSSAPASSRGGSPGGPGSNGGAVNAGFTAPSPDISPPSNERTGPNQTNDGPNRPDRALGQDPNRTNDGPPFNPSVDRDNSSLGEGREVNPAIDRPSIDRPSIDRESSSVFGDAFGSGLSGFNNRENGEFSIDTLFRERGTGDIVLPFGPNSEESLFRSLNSPRTDDETTDLLSRFERGEDFNFEGPEDRDEIPAVPSPYDDLNESVENYQQQVNENREDRDEQLDDSREDAEQTVNEASDALVATYNQLWDDYYEAVDYTADVYYSTVTSSVDYAFAAYEEALQLSTATIDYYIGYATAYSDYCVIYPWDCYSYVYDEVVDTYVYIGDVSATPVATVTLQGIDVPGTFALSTVAQPSAEAYKSLVRFANDQLGAVVEPLYAGELTNDVLAQIDPLPNEIINLLLGITQSSGEAYYGLLNGGVASVVVGDCANEGVCALDDAQLDTYLTTDATGLYGFNIDAQMPTSTNDALTQLFQVFPKLEGLTFAQITNVDGYHFTAVTAGLGVDENGNSVSVSKAVYTGLINIEGRTVAYALVAVGDSFVELMMDAI